MVQQMKPPVPLVANNDLHERSRTCLVRASFAQQRLWFFDQMVPGSAIYNIPLRIETSRELDVDILRSVLEEIVRRHEVLRTSFVAVDGEPWQKLEEYKGLQIPIVDVFGESDSLLKMEADRLARSEAEKAFSLDAAPLIRVSILRFPDHRHRILVTMHHIISDETSVNVFLSELNFIYQRRLNGQNSLPNRVGIQYVDYSEWQRQWLTGTALQTQMDYWVERLKDLPILQFPLDRPRPTIQTYTGQRVVFAVPYELVFALRDLGRREGATLFMVLFAAFNILLGRLAGQEDVVVGVPIAGRNQPELENVIGLFVNTLVLRSDLSGDPTFLQLLKGVRERCIEAYEHQDLPFEKLVEELKPIRDLSKTPLFQITFNYLDDLSEHSIDQNTPGVFKGIVDTSEFSKFDLTAYCRASNDGLRLEFLFNSDLFRIDSIREVGEQFIRLLHSVVSDPVVEISCLKCSPVLPASVSRGPEPQSFLNDRVESVLGYLDFWANVFPDRPAISDSGNALSYADLFAASQRVASQLILNGITPGSHVALTINQTLDLVPLYLGLFMIRACVIPIDSRNPSNRISSLLSDSAACAVVSDEISEYLHGKLHLSSRALLSPGPTSCAYPRTLYPSPHDIAYMIYTSGSTGQPKAVMQSHENLLVHARRYANSIELQSKDRVIMVAHYAFDAALMDLFGTLVSGSTLFIFDTTSSDMTALSADLIEHEITVLHSTPTVVRELISSGVSFPKVRAVVLGGEAAVGEDQANCERAFPAAEFVNGYGPSECTTALQYRSVKGIVPRSRYLPLGKPLTGAAAHIVNRNLREVAIGAIGEIAIGGAGVALGYHGRPDLTAAKFVKSPFAPNERLYLTGDLGRYRSDGCIEFFGRADSQIKLRGHRIELGEVEACLLRHNGVSQAAASVRDDLSGEPQLVLYYTPFEGGSVSSRALREFTETQLPGYMIPSAYVCIAEGLPRSSNGKVDRKALTMLKTQTGVRSFVVAGPRNPHERVIAGIWATVLGPQEFNIDDNFFDLGGHSLKLARVLALLRPHANGPLSIIDLFQHTSIRTLAKFALGAEDGSNRIEITSRTPVYRRFRRTDTQ